MSKKINPSRTGGAKDRLTPGEVAVLMRVVRAHIVPEAELVSSWGTGPWASESLDGLLKRGGRLPVEVIAADALELGNVIRAKGQTRGLKPRLGLAGGDALGGVEGRRGGQRVAFRRPSA